MRARKPKNRTGELLNMGGCIFDGVRDCGWSNETPVGTIRHLKGKSGAFGSFPEVVFPGGKPSTELASKSLKPCLTFAKENIF